MPDLGIADPSKAVRTVTDECSPPIRQPETPVTLGAIRERAYELWERNHRPEGFAIEFWLMAERELKAEIACRRRTAAGRDRIRPDPKAAT